MTITEGAGSQAVTVTATGTGALGITTTDTHTTTVTGLVATGALTVTGAGAVNVATSSTGAHTVVGGSGADTIVGGSGVDVFTGGAGVDVLTGGAGNDIFKFAATDTGLVTGFVSGGTAPAEGLVINTAGLDRIQSAAGLVDFAAGDAIDITNLTISGFTYNGAAIGATTAGLLAGTYSSSATTFTVGAAGRDTLYVYDTDGVAGGTLRGIVLVGYVDAAGNDTASNGVSTGLVGVA